MKNTTHLYKISSHIYSRYSKDELLKIFKKIDICILDLDECITPVVTQVELIKEMLRLIFVHPLKSRDRWLLLRFAPKSLWLYLIVMILKRKIFRLTISSSSRTSIYTFPKLVRNIPKDYFYQGSRRLPRLVYPGFKDVLKNLASFCKVGIITSGLKPVVKEYIRDFNSNINKGAISFYNCNHMVWSEKRGVLVFKDLDMTRIIKGSDAKAQIAKNRMAEFNSHFLLAIGHNEDDIGMAEIAKQSGGLSIGFNPKSNVLDSFDVIIKAKNWCPIDDLVIDAIKN